MLDGLYIRGATITSDRTSEAPRGRCPSIGGMDAQFPPAPDALEPDSSGPSASSQVSEEVGQGMVEYAFILMLVFLAVLLSVQVLGHQTQHLYSNISNGFTGH